MNARNAFACTFFLSCCFSVLVEAQDWPQFRGPDGNGVLPKLEHPLEWSDSKNLAWSVDIPGGGLSSPVVVKDRIFVTTAVGTNRPVSFMEGVRDMSPKNPGKPVKFRVICYKLTDGSKLWETQIEEKTPPFPIHASNSFATETPATDGERLFVYFASAGTIVALDFDGTELWRQDVGAYPTGNGFGPGSSLTFGEGKVFIQCDNDKSSFVVAFDAKTGKEAWRRPRQGRTSWATPLVWKNQKRSELVTCGSGFVTSYDLQTGEELWTLDNIGMSFSASPARDDKRIYFGNSGPRSSGPLVALSTEMSGKRSFDPNSTVAGMDWLVMQAGPGMSSPVAVNGKVYIPGRGMLTCYDSEDGSVIFKERLPMGSMAASVWAAGENVFLMDENGKTLVLKNSDSLEIVATNQINNDLFWSTPSVAGKSLIVRGAKKMYCIRE